LFLHAASEGRQLVEKTPALCELPGDATKHHQDASAGTGSRKAKGSGRALGREEQKIVQRYSSFFCSVVDGVSSCRLVHANMHPLR
jgi:hypothetical protein